MPDPTPDTIAARAALLYELLPEEGRPAFCEIDDLAGMSRGYFSLLLSGRASNPTTDTMVRCAAVLGCKIQWLIAGEGKAPGKAAVVRAVDAARGAKAAKVSGEARR